MAINQLLDEFKRNDYQNDNFLSFLKKIGFHYNVPSVHIAGTNGKGSTANYLASTFINANYKVGLFTSPYFFNINEMTSINGVNISDNEFIEIFNNYEKLFRKYDLSSFEIITFISLSYFMNQHCDIAIIECGMGGLLDATNIFTPILSVITTVSMEHTSFLGKTLSEIAYHKAGIIKEKVPLVIGKIPEEARETIIDVLRENKSKLFEVNEINSFTYDDEGINFSYRLFPTIHIKSNAKYSITDACIALECIKYLSETFDLSNENIVNGFNNVIMPLRMEKINDTPCIIVDGAHNPEAINALVESYSNKYIDKNTHIIFACFRDKNISLMLPRLDHISKDITLTTFDHPRARTEEEYFIYLGDYKFTTDYLGKINELMNEFPDDQILITGSLAFTSIVKKEFLK